MKSKIIYTKVDWFSVSDGLHENVVPSGIQKVKNIWNINGGKSTPEMCELILKYLNCQFLAENYDDWAEYFDDKDFGEFNAIKINVVGVEFTDSILPLIRAEAWVEVKVKEAISDEFLDDWLNEEWGLQTGIMWSWNIPNDGDLDLAMEENSGIEAIWVDEVPK